jgi:hypothetical protein
MASVKKRRAVEKERNAKASISTAKGIARYPTSLRAISSFPINNRSLGGKVSMVRLKMFLWFLLKIPEVLCLFVASSLLGASLPVIQLAVFLLKLSEGIFPLLSLEIPLFGGFLLILRKEEVH